LFRDDFGTLMPFKSPGGVHLIIPELPQGPITVGTRSPAASYIAWVGHWIFLRIGFSLDQVIGVPYHASTILGELWISLITSSRS
jgi:hypothetical protein